MILETASEWEEFARQLLQLKDSRALGSSLQEQKIFRVMSASLATEKGRETFMKFLKEGGTRPIVDDDDVVKEPIR